MYYVINSSKNSLTELIFEKGLLLYSKVYRV